ncbi:MAG: BlaI/MecI/CopY family transcriptional regulator [Armatimonadetes bacterium]|nr:BlaI/MecI/CopY family transcriptional regulator [Armatimonadota bacterium]
MARRPGVGRAEMDILRYIADHSPVTVRQVAEHLAATKGQTRTTALNVMERLREKGYLRREKVEGVFRYSPSVPRAQLLRSLVRDFVQHALGGSFQPFLAYLIEDVRLSPEELRELKALVEQMEAREEAEP